LIERFGWGEVVVPVAVPIAAAEWDRVVPVSAASLPTARWSWCLSFDARVETTSGDVAAIARLIAPIGVRPLR
jgi:hypothetical protein